jgi:putative flippase GtrA
MGNNITRFVFRVLCGIKVSDTQTGLRGIPAELLPLFCEVAGDRFEYETNMLLAASRRKIPIVEVKISTIYLEENASSHFRVIRDSLAIYGAIFKFMFSSLASSVVDLGLFTLFNIFLGAFSLPLKERLGAASIGARIVSSLFNYFLNRRIVFKSRLSVGKTLLRYAVLAVLQLSVSFGSVFALSSLLRSGPGWEFFYKLLVDTTLFFISFFIQRKWVFGQSGEAAGPKMTGRKT